MPKKFTQHTMNRIDVWNKLAEEYFVDDEIVNVVEDSCWQRFLDKLSICSKEFTEFSDWIIENHIII